MSYNRYARRADTSSDDIVTELRKNGYEVVHIGRPVDLLLRHPLWPENTWRLLECKTAAGKAKTLKLRKDQDEQRKFCAEFGVPYAMNGDEALLAVGEKLELYRCTQRQY